MASSPFNFNVIRAVKNSVITADQYGRIVFPPNINIVSAGAMIDNVMCPLLFYMNPNDSTYYSKTYLANTTLKAITANTVYTVTYTYF